MFIILWRDGGEGENKHEPDGGLITTNSLVLIVELLNSAIEAVVDKVSPEFHTLAERAKDMGSAAVLLSLILAGVVWAAAVFDLLF